MYEKNEEQLEDFEELEVVPEDTENWTPSSYVIPEYDDPGSTLESDHDNG